MQHALRAFTPRDAEAVHGRLTFRPNPKINTEQVITELATGEGWCRFSTRKVAPIRWNALDALPSSRIGPVTPAEREALVKNSLVAGVYDKTEDRESAYEHLTGRVASRMGGNKPDTAAESSVPASDAGSDAATGACRRRRLLQQDGRHDRRCTGSKTSPRSRQTVGEAAMKSAARAIGSEVGRRVVRGCWDRFWRQALNRAGRIASP